MKRIIFVLALLIVSIAGYSQTTYTFATYNPLEITAPDNSNTHIIQCATNKSTDVLIYFPTGNAGTVKVNTSSSTITSSPTMSYTTHPNGVIVTASSKTGYKIYLRFSNAADKVIVTKWN